LEEEMPREVVEKRMRLPQTAAIAVSGFAVISSSELSWMDDLTRKQ
jgi:hypothetical protein